MLNFSRLGTPAEHGDVLIEPPPQHLAELAHANAALINSYGFRVNGRDISEIRRDVRSSLCESHQGPLVMTGHQPDFIHAGVWAKHVVASNLADQLGGKAVNLIVDSDAPRAIVLHVPVVDGTEVRAELRFYGEIVHGAAFEGIAALDLATRSRLAADAQRLMGEARFHESCLVDYFSGLKTATASDWVDQMVFARRHVEEAFGIEMVERRVSRVWGGEFLTSMILDAERFSFCYNEALSDYRKRYKVRSGRRPIPDLARRGSSFELPVWVYLQGKPRRRLFVECSQGKCSFFADEEFIGEASEAALRSPDQAQGALSAMSGYVLRPRALSLTMWARMFVGDLFVHGIGGAKYDRITDELIRRYYGVQPPAMACVSATLCAAPTPGVSPALRASVPNRRAGRSLATDARRCIRDIRYNPQRYVTATAQTRALLDRRAQAVSEAIALKRAAAHDRMRRRSLFERIRGLNDRLLAADPSLVREAKERLTIAERRDAAAVSAARRDFFFATLNRQDLQKLCANLTERLTFAV